MLIVRTSVSRTWLHRILIGIGGFLLFWPAATTNLFGDGLSGYEPSSPAPPASLSAWFSGEFQQAADQWWKERFGLRFFFVKLDNQIDFWLYERVYEGATIAFGRDGWLYERAYIEGYCRQREPSPREVVHEGLEGIRALQDALAARGVPLILLITPSKAAVYPDRLPEDACAPHGGGGYDYDAYRPLLDELGIRYVDGYALTEDAKPLWPEITLFSRGGVHWNNLGAYYSAEAVLDAVRPLVDRPIPPLVLDDVVVDHDPNRYDRDLVDYMNLLFPDTDFPVPHPEITMERPGGGGLRVVLVGMSFLEQLAMIYAESGGFERVDHYWYYHHDVRDGITGERTMLERDDIDWETDMLDTDFLVLDFNMLHFQGEHARRFVEDGLAHLRARAGSGSTGR